MALETRQNVLVQGEDIGNAAFLQIAMMIGPAIKQPGPDR
jgi:hypothetical protein